MDPSKNTVNASRWNESFSYVSSSLFNLTKWALSCPPPKPKSIFYFSAPAPTPEPLTIFTFLSAFSIDIFAVFFTCLAAYFLQWVINYFVRFCASLGYVLSGADNRDSLSAPPSPPKTPAAATKQEIPSPAHTPVKMNEPVDCSVSHSSILSNQMKFIPRGSNRNSTASSSIQDGRTMSGSDMLVEELPENPEETEVIVYGAANKPKGKFSVTSGKTEFVWLDANFEQVSITGSFVGFNLCFPLARENETFRIKMNLPPGDHEYEFIAIRSA